MTPLERGDAAPFTGDLFPPNLSVGIGLRLETCREKLSAQDDRRQQREQTIAEFAEARCEVRTDAAAARLAAAEAALDEASAWWRSPVFVAGAAVVVTVLSMLAIAVTWEAFSDETTLIYSQP